MQVIVIITSYLHDWINSFLGYIFIIQTICDYITLYLTASFTSPNYFRKIS